MPAIEDLIAGFALHPHPEGGYYRETYRAAAVISAGELADRFPGARSFSTAILFLLPKGERSKLHRIKSDELWHFYEGGPMTVAEISPSGRVERTTLGRDFAKGQRLQHVVPAGSWFGAYPEPGADFSLVGCTVAPGFDFADLELATRSELLKLFPHAKDIIERLTDAA